MKTIRQNNKPMDEIKKHLLFLPSTDKKLGPKKLGLFQYKR